MQQQLKMSDLPMEMLANILSRLPVKPLLQYRCVSKPWLALIDSSYFINLHLNRSIETNANHSLIFIDGDLYSTDFDSLNRAVKLDHPKSHRYRTGVVGACNGLLCLIQRFRTISYSTDEIVLWNFSTRKQHKLPFASIELRYELSNWSSFIVYGFGFGYDSVHDDYKLVQHYVKYDNSL
ncbi:F-box protein CPR1-like [Cornus florida]|uniref:F-box protein CPR1-like n=1 Tax=Cornus florida TaxID=4283 RepID=UPI0028A25E16|nr:F-box protein CPR1-like [Cornus florida]